MGPDRCPIGQAEQSPGAVLVCAGLWSYCEPHGHHCGATAGRSWARRSGTREFVMSTVSRSGKPSGARVPRGQRLWCTTCDTDAHLFVESVQPLAPPKTSLVDVAYTCVECVFFYSHPATSSQLALVLSRPDPGVGVMQCGGLYFHCGRPMRTVRTDQVSICAPVSTGPSFEELPDVSLPTQLLRCSCGFQLEIPD